jgi:DNA-binding MarR family transcriptional regulator
MAAARGRAAAPTRGPVGGDVLLDAYVDVLHFSRDLARIASGLLGPRVTTNRHVQILQLVARRPGISPSELADALLLHRSAASRLIRRLEREGLLRRRPDDTDRRVSRLEFTTPGRAATAALTRAVDRHLAAAADGYRSVGRSLTEAAHGCGAPAGVAGPATPEGATAVLARAGAPLAEQLSPWLESFGLATVTDRAALAVVRRHGEVRPSRLSEELDLGSSGTTALVGRLVRAGLVERRPDPADGRAALVRCTPRGAEAVDGAVEILARHGLAMGDALQQAADAAEAAVLGADDASGGSGAA